MRILGSDISRRFLLINSLIILASLGFALWAISYSILVVVKALEGWGV